MKKPRRNRLATKLWNTVIKLRAELKAVRIQRDNAYRLAGKRMK